MTAEEEDALVRKWTPLACSLALKRHKGGGRAELDRRKSDALFGLLQGLRSFQPSKGQSLKNWLSKKVKWALIDGEREHGPLSRLQIKLHWDGKHPTLVTLACWQWRGLKELLAAPENQPDRLLQRDLLERLMRGLNARERLIVQWSFFDYWTNARIAKRLRLCESSVSVQVHQILDFLREKASDLGLAP